MSTIPQENEFSDVVAGMPGLNAEPPQDAGAPDRPRRKFGDGPVSGAAVLVSGRILNFLATFVALAVVARILSPADYGLVAMVTSATAFFSLFADFGLSLVTVQRPELSPRQMSTLFWLNIALGMLLGALASGLAPVLAAFYKDPRLFAVTLAIASVFPLTSLGTQHEALLKRNMFFRRLVTVRFLSTLVSVGLSVIAAMTGWGYWALVVQPVALALSASLMFWLAMPWIPAAPTRCEGLMGMLGFGGALTAHGMVGYLANNLDNILIGRYWGNAALGVYSTSYGLMMRPISLAGYGVGEAAIPALSRAASSGAGLRAAFRRMFELTCLLGMPICLAGIFWADDLVLTLLGPQWNEAIGVVRLLFLAAIPRMLAVCTGWVYVATGRPARMLSWQLGWTPVVALAFVLGLPYGAPGVAAAYAIANWTGLVPNYLYCFAGTHITLRDVAASLARPSVLASLAVLVGTLAGSWPGLFPVPGPERLVIRLSFFAAAYGVMVALLVPLVHDRLASTLRRFLQVESS